MSLNNDYQRKLANPKWQRRRLEIMQRDNFTCVKCGATETELQVHHLKYLPNTEPWNYPDSALQTLCVNCHHSETVMQVMSKMKLPVSVWKDLEFAFRNVTQEKLPLFVKRIFKLSTRI